MTAVTTRDRYRARYNVSGEIHELWGWYISEGEAQRKLHRKLNQKMDRMIFLDDIDHQVVKVNPK